MYTNRKQEGAITPYAIWSNAITKSNAITESMQ